MAEQNLDVKVTESGTAVVSSELSKLAGQLDKVTAAQEKETAAATRAAAASEKTADGVAKFLAAQESKFAVVDRVAGLLGKFNLALELVNKAYQIGKVLVEDYIQKQKSLAPALEDTNKKLATQADLIKKIAAARKETAEAAGATPAGITPEQAQRAEALKAEKLIREQEAEVLQQEAAAALSYIRTQEAAPLEDERRTQAARDRLERVSGKLRELDAVLKRNKADQERLQAEIRMAGEPFEWFGPEAPEDPKKKPPGGPTAPRKEEDILADLPDLQSEWVKRLGIKGDGDPLAGDGAGPFDVVARGVNAATEAMRAGLGVVGEYATEVARVQAAYDAAADQAGAFAEATGKSALASAAAALVAGDSIAAALQVTLESKGIEAGVEALWTLGKAFYYTATKNPLAGPMFVSAGYFAATAAAAGVGSALAGAAAGGGGGGGAGARGGAPTERDIGPRRQTGADAGGPTTINVQIDGLSLSTAGQVGEAFLGAMERLRNTPGQRARLERVMTGGNR